VAQVNSIDTALRELNDPILRRANEPSAPSPLDRVNSVNGLTTTAPPTATHRESLAIAQQQTGPLLDRLHKPIEDLANVEKQMNERGALWTPGRIPEVPR
jgi:hypothetical protein